MVWQAPIALMLLLANAVQSARILGLFPFQAKSHFNVMTPLIEELAKRGHEMTVISAYPRKERLENYKDITIPTEMKEPGSVANPFEMIEMNHIYRHVFIRQKSIEHCEKFFTYPEIQELISSDQKFDLILYEPFFRECTYGLFHLFKVPSIQISSNTITSWIGEGVGNPHSFSYIPDLFSGYTDHMTFPERLYNSFFQIFTIVFRKWYVLPQMESIIKRHLLDPSLPSIHELETNASFLLLNSHISINYPRPLTPNSAEVAGMHIKEPKKLPQDLQEYLDDAPHGVIYFSFGSTIRSVLMPEETRNAFLKAFSQVKQKVLWKWEEDILPGKPNNVHVQKWLPQTDILAHPNVKAFVTHCGLLSTQEATYFGVPLIAVPIVRDQGNNARHAQNAGYAVLVDIKNITTESLTWALNEVLNKPSYKRNAMHFSKIFKDQSQKPLDTAVFWVEYVLRHNGAPHMKSAALSLNFFQYYLLDVIAVILCCSMIIFLVIKQMCGLLYRCIFSKSTQPKHMKRTKIKEN